MIRISARTERGASVAHREATTGHTRLRILRSGSRAVSPLRTSRIRNTAVCLLTRMWMARQICSNSASGPTHSNGASRPQPQASSDGANVTLALTRPRAALGLIYTVETSNDLLMWTAATAAQAVFSQTSAMETIHVILAPGGAGLFLRVRVVQAN